MMRQLFLVLPLIIAAAAIKVPVDYDGHSNTDNNQEGTHSHTKDIPVYYTQDEPTVDSYLIPPDPHKPIEVLPDTVVTPATYLLPPAVDQVPATYYTPTESGEQTDWYPIAEAPKDEPINLLPPTTHVSVENESVPQRIIQYPRAGKAAKVHRPSVELEPPAENAPNDFIINVPSAELELPAEEIDEPYRPYGYHSAEKYKPEYPPIVPHLVPPKHHYKHKNPTKLYPKKFPGAFKPVPIPIEQYADELSSEVPRAKPAKPFQPPTGLEGPILTPLDEKRFFHYQQAEKKRKLKQENEESQEAVAEQPVNYDRVAPTEQVVSETNFRYPGNNVYRPAPTPAPLKQKASASTVNAKAQAAAPAPDDRTEFHMHGMKGPHSYQFGYDTGKGKNRQFRFEERDNDGHVRGHYGYMDKFGKLRVVNYRAHPELGFQAEPQEEAKEE